MMFGDPEDDEDDMDDIDPTDIAALINFRIKK